MNTFTIVPRQGGDAVTAPILPGFTLAQHLFLAGAFKGRALCSGAGRCGLCQVRFLEGVPAALDEEREILPAGRLEQGWRLSCRRQPRPGSVIEAALTGAASVAALPPSCPDGVLGIDLGTTSVQWEFHQKSKAVLSGGFHNPQLGAGSEVMSRMALARAPSGALRLRRAVADAVRGVLTSLPCLPGSICLAGNSCMTYLALGLDTSGLASAPYRLGWAGGGLAVLDGGLPEVYIPPLLAPFVGGDISAGLAALEYSGAGTEPPYLLADLGTNGEFALVLPGGRILLASVPMGPALEGVGMAQGMLAGPGAAVGFELVPGGMKPVMYDRGTHMRGVSGTGYLSLLSRLRVVGALDASGRYAESPETPLAAKVLGGLRRERGEMCLEAGGVPLFASDVEALLKVKAAFETAVSLLLDAAGLRFAELKAVLLAGALGEHVRQTDLETLGFIPAGGAATIRAVGNTSLRGACLAAAREDVRQWLAELPGRTELMDVVASPDFQKRFIGAMRFTHAG